MEKPRHSWDCLRPYQAGDVGRVWADLRAEDRLELEDTPVQDIQSMEDLVLGDQCRVHVWDSDQGPMGLIGVTRTDEPDVGIVWALATEASRSRMRYFIRQTPAVLDDLGQGFRVLANFKDSRNKQQISWLRRVGFTFINRHPVDETHSLLEFVRIVK